LPPHANGKKDLAEGHTSFGQMVIALVGFSTRLLSSHIFNRCDSRDRDINGTPRWVSLNREDPSQSSRTAKIVQRLPINSSEIAIGQYCPYSVLIMAHLLQLPIANWHAPRPVQILYLVVQSVNWNRSKWTQTIFMTKSGGRYEQINGTRRNHNR